MTVAISPSPIGHRTNGINLEVLSNPQAMKLDDPDPNNPNNRQLTYVERKVLSDLSKQIVKQGDVPFHGYCDLGFGELLISKN